MDRLVGEFKLVEWITTAPHTQNFSRNQNARNAGTKGVFFSESAICFSNLQKKITPNHYPELEI